MASLFSIKTNLDVIVRNPEGKLFEGHAVALSSFDSKGPFDILPYHANLVSIIREKVIIYETRDKKKEITLERGILKAFENHITILLGIEAFHEELTKPDQPPLPSPIISP